MADRVLPSRDKRSEHGTELAYTHAEFAALANAWRSGRLVDREAMTAWCFGHNRTDDLCERMAPERGCIYGLVLVDALPDQGV